MKSPQQHGAIVAHPGTQHSYQTALALQEAGLLASYLTGFYYKPQGRLGRLCRCLPRPLASAVERELYRRRFDGLSDRLVETFPLGEVLYVAASRALFLRRSSRDLLIWRNERFDELVAHKVRRDRPGLVIAFDSCALRTFEAGRAAGAVCVLDQSIGHIRLGLEVLAEEAELHPDFADSIPGKVPWALVERCTEEALAADLVLAPSLYVKESLLAVGVAPDRIALLPYGADTERFKPRPRAGRRAFRLLFVGQISQRKGVKYLLEAVRQLGIRDLELILVGSVIGSGAGLRGYRHLFRQVPHVPHHEVHKYFAEADVFIYPSLHEGSALAIYEALASGLPVITTANSGSVVRDGMEGFVVPIRDVDALKEKILLLYRREELRREMGRRARLRAEQFTWGAYRRRLGDLASELLSASRGRRCES